MDNKEEKIIQLSGEVMTLCRNTLMVHLRFMDVALSGLIPAVSYEYDLATNGQYLLYDPLFVLKSYKDAREASVRNYLHVLMHCILRHMFIHNLLDQECWDLACDIAVESAISDLNLKAVSAGREDLQKSEITDLRSKVDHLTAERLYRYFFDHRPDEAEMERLRSIFSADDHSIWYLPPEEKMNANGQADPSSRNGRGPLGSTAAEAEEAWADISRTIKQDLESFSKQQGEHTGDLMQNIAEVNREKYDYKSFLKKFAVLGEAMKINEDEFDYIYYTYGLRLYEKMPLIEPLEYKEVKRIREFVIAIDTSGSTSGDLVQCFLEKTYNILQEMESFFTRFHIRILQCDTEIKADTMITCREEFDDYIKNMEILGHGGTDFRPVFDYVDRLIHDHEFTNLKGMIYFTDGWGTFPKRKPDYETAFIFIDNEWNNYNVPPWAVKLILRSEEVYDIQ